MSSVPVHGGLDAPVNRLLPLTRRKEVVAKAASLPSIAVTSADLATVNRLADGTLSPLTGPMTKEQYDLVLDAQAIESNGKRYAWTIPMCLPVTDDEAASLQSGGEAALVGPDGNVVGLLEVSSVYDWDKDLSLIHI